MFWKQVHTKLKVCFIEDNKLSPPHLWRHNQVNSDGGGRLRYCFMFPSKIIEEKQMKRVWIFQNWHHLKTWHTWVIDEPVSQSLSSQKHPRGDVPSRSGLFNHKNYGFGHGNLHHLLKRERERLWIVYLKTQNVSQKWVTHKNLD